MKTYFVSLACAGFAFASLASPSLAQSYHGEYGGGRVIMQSQTGLYTPSSTYIGSGTLSRSAQGKGSGVGGALPAVNMGSTVRTPGDNMYNNDGSDRQANGALIYQDQERAMAIAEFRRNRMLIERARRQQMQHEMAPRGNFYVPGSNTGTATYGSAPSTSVFYRSNGAATYDDSRHATRQF